jgi:hypothetical protein
MKSPPPPLKSLLTRSEPDRATLDRVWAGLRQKETRRYRAPLLFSALVSLSATLIAVSVWLHPSPRAPSVIAAPASRVLLQGQQRFAGGVELTSTDATVAYVTVHDQLVRVEVLRGPVRLAALGPGKCVVTSRRLSFDVAAATVRFEVGPDDDSVVVEQGEVALREPAGAAKVVPAGARFTTGPSWRALAAQGNLAGAWAKLGPEGVGQQARGASLDERSLLADIAAAGHDVPLSITLLEGVLNAPQASRVERALAAYGLGLRLLEHGEPARAAQAFEQSLGLELPVALQNDARARAAEASLRAGDRTAARRWLEAAQ